MFYKRWNEHNHQHSILLECEFERLKAIDEERKRAPKTQWNDFGNRMAVKGIVMSIALAWFLQMTGCYTITNYASYIFEKSGETVFTTNVSSIILAIVQIVGGLVSTQMGDTFGRKTTLALSLGGSTIGLISFAGYLHMRHMHYDVTDFIWLPLTALSLMYVSATMECQILFSLFHFRFCFRFHQHFHYIGWHNGTQQYMCNRKFPHKGTPNWWCILHFR